MSDNPYIIMSDLIEATVYTKDGTLIGDCVGSINIDAERGWAVGSFDVRADAYQPSEIAMLTTRNRQLFIKIDKVNAGIGRACFFSCSLSRDEARDLTRPIPFMEGIPNE